MGLIDIIEEGIDKGVDYSKGIGKEIIKEIPNPIIKAKDDLMQDIQNLKTVIERTPEFISDEASIGYYIVANEAMTSSKQVLKSAVDLKDFISYQACSLPAQSMLSGVINGVGINDTELEAFIKAGQSVKNLTLEKYTRPIAVELTDTIWPPFGGGLSRISSSHFTKEMLTDVLQFVLTAVVAKIIKGKMDYNQSILLGALVYSCTQLLCGGYLPGGFILS